MKNETSSTSTQQPADSSPDAAPTKRSAVAQTPTKKRWKKWPLALGLGAAVIAIAIVGMRPTPVMVQTAEVQRGALAVGVDAQGRTRAKLRYTVAAPISGRLLRTDLKEGQRVEKGDVLARITPPPTDARTAATARAELTAALARQRQSQAARAEATSNLQLAKREARRRADLFAQGFIGAEARDSYAQAAQAAQARLDVASATLAASEAEVQSARSRLLGAGTGAGEGAIDVRAPVGGLVLRVMEESERVVAAGSPLFDLSKGDQLELVIDVLTQEAVQVKAGNPVRITGWGGDTTLAAKVRFVEPGAFTKVSALGVEEQRVNVIGDLVDAPATLGAGYRVVAAIVTWSADGVLQLPTGALFRRAEAWNVFVVEQGRAKLRALEIGHRNTDFSEVKSGLKQGDQVVLFPSGVVADGIKVTSTSPSSRSNTGP